VLLPRFVRQGPGQGDAITFLPERVGHKLKSFCLYWAGRLAFDEVARLAGQFSGAEAISADTIWRWVQEEAARLDAVQQQAIAASRNLPEPAFVACPDLYAPDESEFVVLTDGIGVKSQKPTREKRGTPRQTKTEKRHEIDVLILPRPDGTEQVICEGVSATWSLVDATRAFLRHEWQRGLPPIVALTDGAKTIRADLSALLGSGVRVVLDWYHLAKRVYQQLSMAAHSMQERASWEASVLSFLWRGRVVEARGFLAGLSARNARALSDLVGYLDKHTEEIIDYERRQQAGKPIGSGRMEKGVDQVVGHRQKGKGMSWTKQGSRALALLKVAELNARASRPCLA